MMDRVALPLKIMPFVKLQLPILKESLKNVQCQF